jgi:hypothetical protein
MKSYEILRNFSKFDQNDVGFAVGMTASDRRAILQVS